MPLRLRQQPAPWTVHVTCMLRHGEISQNSLDQVSQSLSESTGRPAPSAKFPDSKIPHWRWGRPGSNGQAGDQTGRMRWTETSMESLVTRQWVLKTFQGYDSQLSPDSL